MQNALLATYVKLLDLSQQMATLAKSENWEELTAVERERSALLEKLPKPTVALTGDEGQKIARIIGEILALDATVREHVEPWMQHVATLLPALTPKF